MNLAAESDEKDVSRAAAFKDAGTFEDKGAAGVKDMVDYFSGFYDTIRRDFWFLQSEN